MDSIFERLKNPVAAGIAGILGGLLVGLLIGWVLWPVKYVDTTPDSMRADLQEDYLRMAIDSFQLTGDTELALRRYANLGDQAEANLLVVQQAPGAQDVGTIVTYTQLINAAMPPETVTPETPAAGPSWLVYVIGFGLLFIVGVGAAAYLLLFRRPRTSTAEMTPAQQARALSRQTEVVDYEAMGQAPPISQFVTTYVIKDDLFDDSFSIDSPSGEFLGECGVGISETIGVGDPKKVTAFEVWLFDKNDIQTVTKVLMSANAFNDLATRQRLAEKGEPVLVEPQRQVVLETQTLQLVATVSDTAYGDGPLPPSSYFDRLTLELAVWQKETA
ncbi:MAG: hypothetical protein ACOYY3_03960 [Chloroflexota bacterium]